MIFKTTHGVYGLFLGTGKKYRAVDDRRINGKSSSKRLSKKHTSGTKSPHGDGDLEVDLHIGKSNTPVLGSGDMNINSENADYEQFGVNGSHVLGAIVSDGSYMSQDAHRVELDPDLIDNIDSEMGKQRIMTETAKRFVHLQVKGALVGDLKKLKEANKRLNEGGQDVSDNAEDVVEDFTENVTEHVNGIEMETEMVY